MASLDELTKMVAATSSIQQAVELLLSDLAERVKATSNDTNIQRLARELRAAAPELVNVIARKPAASHDRLAS